ncbi:hypothetical protein L0P88_17830 [Muricauda sp. SCSIO 64092]|uniref:hypothetical protein n=1 Tax=Allomuricauda sp. SCSIO 64092 TaxID=2908842 RepID=UPI001FF103E0|nr:hypothetical protein [Muricauda sp. SCSIO 64092]UOY05787.1 hypothetical protein L0P88_17830 [Muricauda sp. SCSIO 64092]
MSVDLVYANQTDSTIRFKMFEPEPMGFIGVNLIDVKLNPQSQRMVYAYETDGAPKDPKPESCCQGFLEGVLGAHNTIIINDTSYVIHGGEKSVLISNYKDSIISDRHFRYTYTFTETDFENAQPCNGNCDD